MKIVVLSDIHANLNAFEAVVSKFPNYDELFCLGDLVGYGPDPNEIVERIQELRPTVVLMGNHDYAVVTGDVEGFSSNAAKAVEWTRRQMKDSGRRYLASLTPSIRLERDGVSFALYHASPRDPLFEYIYPGISETVGRSLVQTAGAQVVLLGHTHIPMLLRYNGNLMANPGSVGQPRDGDPRSSFALLTTCAGGTSFDVYRVENDVSSVARRIIRNGLPGFLADRLYIGV